MGHGIMILSRLSSFPGISAVYTQSTETGDNKAGPDRFGPEARIRE